MHDRVRKIHVPPGDEARIICERCGFTQRTNIESFDLDKHYKVICHCGHEFRILIEQRAAHRVETHLDGIYSKVGNDYVSGTMTVENLSFFGIGFTTERRDDIHVGDVIRIKFRLDDAPQSTIVKEVLVKWVDNTSVGGEFGDFNTYEQQLTAYLDR